MIAGTANPKAITSWLAAIAQQLIVGLPPLCPPVAYDGVGGNRDAETTAEVTFTGRTITRSAGSWIDDGWKLGYSLTVVGSTDNDGDWGVVKSISNLELVLTANPAAPFTDEGPTADVEITGAAPDGFSLYVGPQHVHNWTGGDVCTIVVADMEPATPQAFESQPAQPGAYGLLVELHIWGTDEPDEPAPLATIMHDIERYESPTIIYENVFRAMAIASRGLGMTLQAAPFENDTGVLRFGEAMVARFMVGSFPVRDAVGSPLSNDLTLQPGVNIAPPGV